MQSRDVLRSLVVLDPTDWDEESHQLVRKLDSPLADWNLEQYQYVAGQLTYLVSLMCFQSEYLIQIAETNHLTFNACYFVTLDVALIVSVS